MNGNFHFYGNAAAAETESDSSSDRYESESDWEDEYCGELTLSHPECDLPETPAAPPVFGEIGTDTQKSKGCGELFCIPCVLSLMACLISARYTIRALRATSSLSFLSNWAVCV
jgi:hypothetical protein